MEFCKEGNDVGMLQDSHYSCVVFLEENASMGANDGRQGDCRVMV
jgi:hypothetical protein